MCWPVTDHGRCVAAAAAGDCGEAGLVMGDVCRLYMNRCPRGDQSDTLTCVRRWRTDGRPKWFATNVRHSSSDLQLWRLPRLTLYGHHSLSQRAFVQSNTPVSLRLPALVIIRVLSPYFSCPPPLVCSFSLHIGIRILSQPQVSHMVVFFWILLPTLFLLRENLPRFLFVFLFPFILPCFTLLRSRLFHSLLTPILLTVFRIYQIKRTTLAYM